MIKKKLDIVNKPINKAHGLPNECYTNKEYTLIERKKLFEDKWTVIGTASSLKNIGDVKPFTPNCSIWNSIPNGFLSHTQIFL